MNQLYRNKWTPLQIETNQTEALIGGLSLTLQNYLISRGMHLEEIPGFLHPKLRETPLSGVKEAKERILEAIKEKQKIIIFGDYDVDGMTSSALLLHFFESVDHPVEVILPNRYDHGYGLNPKSLELIPDADLLITVDCGISAIEEIIVLKERMDVIVTDHHEPLEVLPEAIIINPKLDEGFASLAGVGVAYHLVHSFGFEEDDFLILAMIGTIADVMPLQDENRYLVQEGLKRLPQTKLPGVKLLFEHLNIPLDKVRASDIAFRFAPHLNAAGRMNDPYDGLGLLVEKDPKKLIAILERLVDSNLMRKKAEETILKSVFLSDEKIMIDKSPEWLTGVLGLAAARVVESKKVPAILLFEDEDTLKGSARSIGDFNILDAIKSVEDLLLRFGGHKQAAGLELKKENFCEFKSRMEEYALTHLKESDQATDFRYFPLDLSAVNLRFVHELTTLEPYGVGNPKPIFRLDHLTLERIKILGKHKNVYRLEMIKDDRELVILSFQKPAIQLQEKVKYDILFQLEENEFRGIISLQLMLKDIRYHEPTIDSYSPVFLRELERLADLFANYGKDSEDGYLLRSEHCKEPKVPLVSSFSKQSQLKDNSQKLVRIFMQVPDRDSLVSIYKKWRAQPKVQWQDVQEPLRELIARKVFEELGLIAYTEIDGGFEITLLEVSKKQDLSESQTFIRSLKAKEDFYGFKAEHSGH